MDIEATEYGGGADGAPAVFCISHTKVTTILPDVW